MGKARRLVFVRALVLLAIIALSVFIFTLSEEQLEGLKAYGYPGTFVLSILANATVLFPGPGLLIVFSMGARLHPLGVGLAAGSGAALGELSGYLAGFSGQAVIDNSDLYKRMVEWVQRNGPLTVLVLAFLPNPLFDITGIAAGALKMPVAKFLFWCWIGKILKMTLIALAGAGVFSIPILNDFLIR